jgi:hypothetical protein
VQPCHENQREGARALPLYPNVHSPARLIARFRIARN